MMQPDENHVGVKKCRVPFKMCCDRMFKVAVIGDSATGKTSLIRKASGKGFFESYESTIGIDFNTLYYQVGATCSSVKLQIWDTAGQERFRCMTTTWLKNVHAVIIVYALDNEASLKRARTTWLEEVQYAREGEEQEKKPLIFMVGNKSDTKVVVSKFDPVDDLENDTIHRHFTVSAKDGSGVDMLFEDVVRDLYSRNPEIGKNNRNERKVDPMGPDDKTFRKCPKCNIM